MKRYIENSSEVNFVASFRWSLLPAKDKDAYNESIRGFIVAYRTNNDCHFYLRTRNIKQARFN